MGRASFTFGTSSVGSSLCVGSRHSRSATLCTILSECFRFVSSIAFLLGNRVTWLRHSLPLHTKCCHGREQSNSFVLMVPVRKTHRGTGRLWNRRQKLGQTCLRGLKAPPSQIRARFGQFDGRPNLAVLAEGRGLRRPPLRPKPPKLVSPGFDLRHNGFVYL